MSTVRNLRRRFLRTPLSPFFLARRGIAKAFSESSEFVRGIVLDIGCGEKPYAYLFRWNYYVGVDLPSNSIQSGVVDAYASGLALPFASEVFDTVICSEVLEHVPDPGQLFIEARRVLRRGGHLLLTTPQTWGLHEEPHDYFRYTKYGLRELAERAGMTVVRVAPTSGFWVTWAARTADFLFLRHAYGRGLIRETFWGFVVAVIQTVGWSFDKLYRGAGDTLDNLLVARRP